MIKRLISLALALVLVLGLVPAADAFGRDPLAPESVDRCCTTLRTDLNDPNYHRPDFEGKLITITPPAGGGYLRVSGGALCEKPSRAGSGLLHRHR